MNAVACADVYYASIDTKYRYLVLDAASVDGLPWYQIYADREVREWIIQQACQFWHYTYSKGAVDLFDINEELMLLITLKWNM